MQRLRSPFRLRPGPGSEQRKGKGRKEEQHVPEPGTETAGDARRASGNDPPMGSVPASAGNAGPQIRHKITGASLRKRRTPDEQRGGDANDHSTDPGSGSE